MPEVLRTPTAQSGLVDIWDYAAQGGSSAADRLIDDLCDRMELLAEFPLMGRDRPELGPQFRSFPFDSYVVFYQPIEFGVRILRVLHGARDVAEVFGGSDRNSADHESA